MTDAGPPGSRYAGYAELCTASRLSGVGICEGNGGRESMLWGGGVAEGLKPEATSATLVGGGGAAGSSLLRSANRLLVFLGSAARGVGTGGAGAGTGADEGTDAACDTAVCARPPT